MKESIKELSDNKRNNFRQLFFESLCSKEKLQKSDESNLNEEFLGYVRELAVGIEESKQKYNPDLYSLLFTDKDKGSKYISKGKSIYSNLTTKGNDLRENVLNGTITPKQLVKMDVKV